ncbi:hypothetical protein RM543_12835 [Roseicyclus sp. F158]|uniref:Uncharacterized protein n=1 Tax=Tropicimonas omnivorans TaxID=3075590 RepID=A0ABU3DIM6_9RHOB|nr:hypothetical protein [Roseicyclus sp. F158]MDT0683575.1 hypothetical protein [Roseicyclus sp. F158]
MTKVKKQTGKLMTKVKNRPESYRKRSIEAPQKRITDDKTKAEALRKFLNAPVTERSYIDMRKVGSQK